MDQKHYLRFARALALAAIVPGCTGAGPAPEQEPEVDAAASTSDAHVVADASSDVDAGLPFSSGPIVPPELPASFS